MQEDAAEYPVNFSVEYAEQLDRLGIIFRLFTVIPIAVILALVSGGGGGGGGESDQGWDIRGASGGLVVLPVMLMLLFRQKYPRWWFDWNVALTNFGLRVGAYFLLLRGEYPSTDEEQAVHFAVRYPNARTELNRWLPLVKWFLAIPHLILLVFLYLAVVAVTVIAWFAILITGSYPRGLFDFVVGVIRWSLRVEAYAFLLTTDRYPPFSLSE